jgi:hypothetical protein
MSQDVFATVLLDFILSTNLPEIVQILLCLTILPSAL